MKYISVALLGAASLAVAELHGHNHGHHHAARRASPVEAREAVTKVVQGAVETVYVLDGKDIPLAQVQEGLKDGKYIVLPDATTSTQATTKTAPQFFQKTTTTAAPTTTTAKPKPTAPAAPPAPPAPAPPAANPGAGNVNTPFPSGQIPCSQFPSEYGAVPVPWMGLGGWAGVQQTPDFTFGLDKAISYIATAIEGSGCTEKAFCSYACPAGYQKSQWPAAQGSTGQSIGGLYCNTNGMLELSNPSEPTICIAGTGGVQVKNTLSKNVCICRTDYPGTESETIPLDVLPGETSPLTCPDANTYYQWEGAHTSAQYYVNPSGAPCSEACTWGSAGTNLGNWAPMNAGVGKGTDGITYLSIFQNAPTNTDGKLNFNVRITGASGDCEYVGGQYLQNGQVSPTGCTVSLGRVVVPVAPSPNNITGRCSAWRRHLRILLSDI